MCTDLGVLVGWLMLEVWIYDTFVAGSASWLLQRTHYFFLSPSPSPPPSKAQNQVSSLLTLSLLLHDYSLQPLLIGDHQSPLLITLMVPPRLHVYSWTRAELGASVRVFISIYDAAVGVVWLIQLVKSQHVAADETDCAMELGSTGATKCVSKSFSPSLSKLLINKRTKLPQERTIEIVEQRDHTMQLMLILNCAVINYEQP